MGSLHMNNSVTDEMVNALIKALRDDQWARAGTIPVLEYDERKVMRAALEAALRSQGKVVNASDVQKVIDRWDNGQYGPGEVVQALRNLTAIIGEGD